MKERRPYSYSGTGTGPLADALRRRRQSQAAFAAELGMTPIQLSRIIRAQRWPRQPEMLLRISKASGVSVDHLVRHYCTVNGLAA